MSLRQLKFKPKFLPPSKDKKNEEVITAEITRTKCADSNTSLRTPKSLHTPELQGSTSVKENCSNKVSITPNGWKTDNNPIRENFEDRHFKASTVEKLYNDLSSTKNTFYKRNIKNENHINSDALPLEVILEVSNDSNLPSPKCNNIKEDNGAVDFSNYSLSFKNSYDGNISEEVESSKKEKPILPSLRQLKCKPKLSSLTPRSVRKETVKLTKNKKIPENDKSVPCSSPPILNNINGTKSSEVGQSDSFPIFSTNTLENTEARDIVDKQEILDKTDSCVAKEPLIGKHRLPIRQLNFKPKVNLGDRNNRVWIKDLNSKTSLLENRNIDDDKKCDDVLSPKVKKNFGRSTLSPKKIKKNSGLESTFSSIIKEHNSTSKNVNKNRLDEMEPFSSIIEENNYNSKNVNKNRLDEMESSKEDDKTSKNSLHPTKTTFSESISKNDECSLKGSNKQQKIKHKSKIDDICESLRKKKYNSEMSINSSKDTLLDTAQRKKKDPHMSKSGAVYGSKSIRSCHLGIPFKPKLTNRSKRPFATSTFGKMSFEAKTQFEKKFGDKTPDVSKLTMLDLIFYNPSSNPMPQPEDEPEDGDVNTTKIEKIDLQSGSSVPNTSDDINKANDNNDIPVPQLKLSSDGKVIIAQESLVVEQSLGEISENVQNITFESYKTRLPSRGEPRVYKTGWTQAETLKFYKALHIFGSDFETMKNFFPNRTRSNLKSKFKKEEKQHGKLIDKIMTTPAEFDVKKAREELEFERTYDLAIATLGRSLQKPRPRKNNDHYILRKARKYDYSAKQLNDIFQKSRCESIPPYRRPSLSLSDRSVEPPNNRPPVEDNIVISTNIECEELKFTQFTTYNSNNLDNPIEVNATISHESVEPLDGQIYILPHDFP